MGAGSQPPHPILQSGLLEGGNLHVKCSLRKERLCQNWKSLVCTKAVFGQRGLHPLKETLKGPVSPLIPE